MIENKTKSLINVVLRFGLFCLKFLQLFFITKLASDDDQLGQYFLYVATITIFSSLAGFQTYQFTLREYLKSKLNSIFMAQIAFFAIIYLSVFILFNLKIFTIDFPIWLWPILFSEHLCLEISRLYIAKSESIKANLVVFYGTFSFFLMIIIYSTILKGYNLVDLYINWAYISLFNVILYIVLWFKNSLIEQNVKNKYKQTIDGILLLPQFISQSYKICLLYFGVLGSSQAILYGNRFFIDYFHNKKAVAIFSFYFSISNMVSTLCFAAVFSIYTPKIINIINGSHKFQEIELFLNFVGKLSLKYSIFFSVCSFLMLPFVLDILGKEYYLSHYGVFLLLLAGVNIFIYSQKFHLYLYSRGKDMLILKFSLLSLVFNGICMFVFIPKLQCYGGAIAFLLTNIMLNYLKYYVYYKEKKESNSQHNTYIIEKKLNKQSI